MTNKSFVLHKEVIDIFHNKCYIPTIEKCHLILLMLGFLVQWNGRIPEMIFRDNSTNIHINKRYIKQKNSAKQLVYKYKFKIGV